MTYQMQSSNSMDERAQYEQSVSIETGITTIDATMPLPLTILPPELFDSIENVNYTTDVWSFGILLWEMFTGGMDVNRYMRQLHAQATRSSSLPWDSEIMKFMNTI